MEGWKMIPVISGYVEFPKGQSAVKIDFPEMPVNPKTHRVVLDNVLFHIEEFVDISMEIVSHSSVDNFVEWPQRVSWAIYNYTPTNGPIAPGVGS